MKERAIDMERLRANLSDVLGAKLLLLDGKGDKGAAHPLVGDARLIGDLRYVWQGGANQRDRRHLLADLDQVLAHHPLWGAVREKLVAAASQSANLAVFSANPEGYDGISLKK